MAKKLKQYLVTYEARTVWHATVLAESEEDAIFRWQEGEAESDAPHECRDIDDDTLAAELIG